MSAACPSEGAAVVFEDILFRADRASDASEVMENRNLPAAAAAQRC